jgi:Xaa-Pro aminopeptidase
MSSDADLKRLLDESGVERTVAEVKDLIRGVAAAPPQHPDGAWLDLVAPPGAMALRRHLEMLLVATKAEARDAPPAPVRLERLRGELRRRGLDGLILPLTDEHGSEYLPDAAQRLGWLTGFTGSAGLLIVLGDRAALFVDGRYTLQADEQLDPDLYERRHITDEPPGRWISDHLRSGARLGYDPALHRRAQIRSFEKAARRAGGELVAVEGPNPVDVAWTGRPPPPIAPIDELDDSYAGEARAAKCARIGREIAAAGADLLVLTAPDSIAWLLNIRGGDVPFNPLVLANGLLHADGAVELFVDPRKLRPGQKLGNRVSVQPIEAFAGALEQAGQRGAAMLVDPTTVSVAVLRRLESAGGRLVEGDDPVVAAKAVKNRTEVDGARAAQRRDGAALCRFLAWLECAVADGTVGEIEAAARLLEERAMDPLFRGESFPAISGAGPNGAIVHYRVSAESSRPLEAGSLYLIDSGGQYLDGTTDVTRTIAVGTPDATMRRHFTLVLKGHIAIATALFPTGTAGGQIDAFARRALWRAGLDFDHGTGHGIGAYLCVHEGPQRISKRGGDVALKPGMILSNEPGYYRIGAYGIRIENLVVVGERDTPPDGERALLGFETITRVPIDRRLVEPRLLDADERAWLENYHARVRADLLDLVDGEDRVWLLQATEPLRA